MLIGWFHPGSFQLFAGPGGVGDVADRGESDGAPEGAGWVGCLLPHADADHVDVARRPILTDFFMPFCRRRRCGLHRRGAAKLSCSIAGPVRGVVSSTVTSRDAVVPVPGAGSFRGRRRGRGFGGVTGARHPRAARTKRAGPAAPQAGDEARQHGEQGHGHQEAEEARAPAAGAPGARHVPAAALTAAAAQPAGPAGRHRLLHAARHVLAGLRLETEIPQINFNLIVTIFFFFMIILHFFD